jgi:hypothetical protein
LCYNKANRRDKQGLTPRPTRRKRKQSAPKERSAYGRIYHAVSQRHTLLREAHSLWLMQHPNAHTSYQQQRHRQYFRYFFHTFLDKKITQPRSYAIFTYKYNDKKRNNFGLMIAIYQQNF